MNSNSFENIEIEKIELEEELNRLKLHYSELESTNNHLISATFREREMKRKLAETIEELNRTKLIVDNQHKRISESINYSKKIQQAINPTESDLKEIYPESFILYLPKDVISGDFPWLFRAKDYTYIAAVDCTGHGVPGAMMSMIGSLLLNDIVNSGQILMPSVILRKLHESVVKTLKQNTSDTNSNDGMDIALCCIDKKNKQIFFSGAHRPLFHLSKGIINVVPGDKYPIGGMHYKDKNFFSDKVINYSEGDAIYLFTDGLPDQIGGSDKRKLLTKNIQLYFEEKSFFTMPELKSELSNFITTWKGDNKQVDDILTIGIKF